MDTIDEVGNIYIYLFYFFCLLYLTVYKATYPFFDKNTSEQRV